MTTVIKGSVGKLGANDFSDVKVVQRLLNIAGSSVKTHVLLREDGHCGMRTIDAISTFQRRIAAKVCDGRVDPYGSTIKKLNESGKTFLQKQSQLSMFQHALTRFKSEANTFQKEAQSLLCSSDIAIMKALQYLTTCPVHKVIQDHDAPGGYCFPMAKAPLSKIEGGRAFGANRDNGKRKHAGVDLIAPVGTPIYAVANGVVEEFKEFYKGSYCLVVNHNDFVIRYGEVGELLPPGVGKGKAVKRGQVIAYVGKMEGTNSSMLHFERYSGKSTGPLTQRNRPPFQRRDDLMDPTKELLTWPYPAL